MSPAQKRITLAIALKFQKGIGVECILRCELIHLHRVVDYQLCWLKRIDQSRVAAHLLHGIAHGSQVHHRRNSGKILHQDTRGREGNFLRRNRMGVPVRQKADIIGSHAAAIFRAQQIFKKHPQRVRQMLRRSDLLINGAQTENFKLLPPST